MNFKTKKKQSSNLVKNVNDTDRLVPLNSKIFKKLNNLKFILRQI